MLFLIYINDLRAASTYKFYLFADGITLVLSHNNPGIRNKLENLAFTFISCIHQSVAQELDDNWIHFFYMSTLDGRCL